MSISMTPDTGSRLRMGVLGVIVLSLFAAMLARLWYLQVLSGDKYRAEANNNRIREIKVQAPRGEIVDRDGRVLVDNRTGLAVKVTPGKLPSEPGERREQHRPDECTCHGAA